MPTRRTNALGHTFGYHYDKARRLVGLMNFFASLRNFFLSLFGTPAFLRAPCPISISLCRFGDI
ncbi:hypothetical protein J4530_02595 [Neisseria subflava]|nr:hypothetical protein [Neisseria subflava]